MKSLTIREKIMVGALSLGRGPVDDARLTVECWKRWPDTFGLRGYPHPDSNRVMAKLSDLQALGLLVRTELGIVNLTPKGIEHAQALTELAAHLETNPS